MPPPIHPWDHVPSEEVLNSFLRPFTVKIKPFNIPISTKHLAIFKGRPVAPHELPFSKGMIWQHHEIPKLGIHYEYGLHLSHKVVPIGQFLLDCKWRKYRKRHYPPCSCSHYPTVRLPQGLTQKQWTPGSQTLPSTTYQQCTTSLHPFLRVWDLH